MMSFKVRRVRERKKKLGWDKSTLFTNVVV